MVYQGGKSKYAQYIVPILQNVIDEGGYSTFIDGCCGGCAIIDKIKCDNKIAIDNNKYLIALFNHLIFGGMIQEDPPSKAVWDKVKADKEAYPDWYVGLIEHLCSFNGRGFIGGYGADSATRHYYIQRRANLLAQMDNLKDVKFIADDINNLQVKNCVIYIDPPYNHTKKYDSLIGNPFDYDKFWNTARRLSKDNIVFISEESAPEDFESVWSIEVVRNIKGNKKVSIEALFRYKGEQEDEE